MARFQDTFWDSEGGVGGGRALIHRLYRFTQMKNLKKTENTKLLQLKNNKLATDYVQYWIE